MSEYLFAALFILALSIMLAGLWGWLGDRRQLARDRKVFAYYYDDGVKRPLPSLPVARLAGRRPSPTDAVLRPVMLGGTLVIRAFLLVVAAVVMLASTLTGCRYSPARGSDADAGGKDGGGIVVITDGSGPTDGGGTQVTITENLSPDVAPGSSVFCNSGTATTRDNAWYRAFRPSDFGIDSVLHITRITFASESAEGSTPVTVRIHHYSGATGTTMLDQSKMTQAAAITGTVPDNQSPQDLAAPLVADIPIGGVFVVEISSTDTRNGQGIPITWFHAGANSAAESDPDYFKSAACGIGVPSAQTRAVIMSVEGTI